jgi:hypothetical protein
MWLGLLGYLAYTYAGAAFAYGFNALFPVYVALFGQTGASLIGGLSGVDAVATKQAFDAGTPRRGVIAFVRSQDTAYLVTLCIRHNFR